MHVVAEVDAAANLQHSLADVAAQAQQRHADDLRAYREGIRRMAANEGRLPPDDAERLIAASRSLGISAKRIADDTSTMLHVSRVEAEIESIMANNVKRREPLEQLREDHSKAQETFTRVRVECEQKLKAAEADLTAKHRAVQAIENQRDERVDAQQATLLALRNSAVHLFSDVSPEALRRIVDPQR
jgi:hypothetical protein